MKFDCPHCKQRLGLKSIHAGRVFNCPKCGGNILAPASAPSPTPVAAQPAQAAPLATPVAPAPPPAPAAAGPTPALAAPPPLAPDKPLVQPPPPAAGMRPMPQSAINRGNVTITQFMAEKKLQGGVDLHSGDPSTATGDSKSGAQVLTADQGKKYTLGNIVTKGGMGAILQAKDINVRRSVAMKVLLDPQHATQEQILRFIQEAQVTGQLEHPAIVPLHELGVDASGNVFYTMKFVHGVTLKEIIKKILEGDQPTITEYPLARLLNIFQRVCDGIAFAHSKRVIHRDLKPENIMVGEYGEVLVVDWGLAKVLSRRKPTGVKAQLAARHAAKAPIPTVPGGIESVRKDAGAGVMPTLEGDIMGTPPFMAPEQALGKTDELDERTDIYSLGTILYNILTLRPPVVSNDLGEMLTKVQTGDIPHPTEYNPTRSRKTGKQKAAPKISLKPLRHIPGLRIPDSLSAVTMKALSLEPNKRYQTVKELQKEIEAYQQGFATGAEHASVWKQLGLLVKRNKGVFATFVCMLIILLGSMAAYTWVNVQALRKFEAEQAKRQADRKASAPAMVKSGRGFIEAKEWKDAMVAISTAIEYDPNQPDARLLQVALLFRLGKYEEALAACEVYLERFPDDKSAKRMLPVCQLGAKHQGKGISGAEIAEVLREQKLFVFAAEFLGAAKEKGAERLKLYQAQIEKAWAGAGSGLKMGEDGSLTLSFQSQKNIVDLTPLKGIPLTELDLSGTQVTDLSPLMGMPLSSLTLGYMHADSKLRDLSPLKGMPLTSLGLTRTLVTDLTPLKGMPLSSLHLDRLPVSNLSPLMGMQLKSLNLWGCRNVSALTPLKGMSLTSLNLDSTPVADLTPLKGMPLTSLNLRLTAVTDLSTLKGIPLTSLNLDSTKIADLTPLKGMPLTSLILWACLNVSDLTPLKGMPLTSLNLQQTSVSDLSPLKGMPLIYLDLNGTPVTDLSPLKGMKTLTSIGFDPVPILLKSANQALAAKDYAKAEQEARKVIEDWADVPAMAGVVPKGKEHLVVLPMMKNPNAAEFPASVKVFGGHHYYIWTSFMRWADAKTLCESVGGHLVTITSREEHAFVMELAKGTAHLHIGLTKDATGIKWITSEPWDAETSARVAVTKDACGCLITSDLPPEAKTGDFYLIDAVRPFIIEWDR